MVNPNKIDEKQKKRAEHIKENLMRQGLGQDEAANRALQIAAEEQQGGAGGGSNAGGEAGSRRTPPS